MTEIIEGLGRSERERIGALREGGRFFWIDLAVDDTSRDELGAALGISEPALERLFEFGSGVAASRSFYADRAAGGLRVPLLSRLDSARRGNPVPAAADSGGDDLPAAHVLIWRLVVRGSPVRPDLDTSESTQ
jgi:hypothetical protein